MSRLIEFLNDDIKMRFMFKLNQQNMNAQTLKMGEYVREITTCLSLQGTEMVFDPIDGNISTHELNSMKGLVYRTGTYTWTLTQTGIRTLSTLQILFNGEIQEVIHQCRNRINWVTKTGCKTQTAIDMLEEYWTRIKILEGMKI